MLKDAPGVAHLPIIDPTNIPFRLLHAKVALLGFRHQENYGQWQLRLLVSTGNWTRQTLEESLNLIWRIDITSESLEQLGLDVKQDCVDIKAAWDLMTWIQQFFDTRLLNASAHGRLSETMNALQQVRRWIETCLESAQGRSRFFDNRSDSLLSQLPDKIKASGEGRRNRLSMGSGFYETSDDSQNPPEVPMAILKTLRDERLLTGKNVDLYVNPMACQAIATARKPLQELGISIRPAAIPITVFGEGAQRSLHAKFLFSAYKRDKSNACTNAWVYLGSGNLTHPGFANKMSASSGNLEAGVVFAPNSLCWQKSKANQDNLVLTSLLPIQWDEEVGDRIWVPHGGILARNSRRIHAMPPSMPPEGGEVKSDTERSCAWRLAG